MRDPEDGARARPGGDPARSAASYRVEREAAKDAAEPDAAVAQRPTGVPDGAGADGAGGDGGATGGPPRGVGRMASRAAWVDVVVDQAIARGEFDDLPLAGRPLPGLDRPHDPDWWLRSLVRREQLSGLLPEALQLRVDAERLPERLDAIPHEPRVREVLAEFNERVVAARRQLLGGPPVVTPLRDVEADVAAWRERRAAARAAAPPAAQPEPAPAPRRGRWRRRRVDR